MASGQFLIDSEASLQGVLARAAAPAAAARAARGAGAASSRPPHRAAERKAWSWRSTPTRMTLEHEPMPALKWPAMTMPFQLADTTLAQGLKKGQAVQFGFVKQGDDYVVTRMTTCRRAGRGGHSGHAAPASGAGRSDDRRA